MLWPLWSESEARNVGRTKVGVAIVAVAVAALAAQSAAAAVEVTASMTPRTIHYPRTQEIEYRLTLTTGDVAERLRIEFLAPGWPGESAQGSPVRLAGQPTLEGVGTIEDFTETGGRSLAYSCIRGYGLTRPRVVLSLPANSTSTLVARYATGRAAPWPRTDYRVRFVVRGIAGGPSRVVATPPRPALAGKTGVRFALRLVPAEPTPGDRVRVVGRTFPALAGETVRVRTARTAYIRPGHDFFEGPMFPADFGRPWLVGTASVGERGWFALPGWVARAQRFYAVWASYRSTRRDLVSDRSCPSIVWVPEAARRR
jgi:hypothetical protein